jgi:ATP-binding cassette subfamily B protein
VFHEGRLVQRGGHEALLSDSSGKYCELWNAQAQYYASEAASTASERQRC